MKQFADGLFIKNDDNGKPCRIGDNIKVIVEEGNMYAEGGGYAGGYLPEDEYIGILVLLKSKVRSSSMKYNSSNRKSKTTLKK